MGDLGCYGNTRLKTPNIDQLATQGTRYGQFYVAGSVCSHNRVAAMTGVFPAGFGIHGHLTPETATNANRDMPDFWNSVI